MATDSEISARARALHDDCIIFDCLTSSPNTPAQAERMQRGGLTGTNLTVGWVDIGFHPASKAIVDVRRAVAALSEQLTVATSVAQIRQAKEEGRSAIVIGFQNGKPVEDDVRNLDALYHLGLRIMQLTYNDRNYLADGCTERRDGGLSDLGVATVRRMAELGMAVDLSHCSRLTCLDAIEASPVPVLISHANPSALFPNPRNKDDEVIRALAAKGGVIGACAWSPLLVRRNEERPTLSDLIDAVDYLVQLVGIDHVAIGTDLGEGTYVKEQWEGLYLQRGAHSAVTSHLGDWWGFEARFPPELGSVVLLPRITEALLQRGYGEDDVRKLWGENALRLLEQVWSGSQAGGTQ